MLFDGNSRKSYFGPPAIALSLYRMFNRRNGVPKFSTREEICEYYKIAPNSNIILSGTEKDAPLERWWNLGVRRHRLIQNMRDLGIVLVTTPNYSLFTDQPRTDDLHSMKRIGIVHAEFQAEGLLCALHINARTETDFHRWTEYIVSRPEITHLAYEFCTGPGWAGRRELHTSWLVKLAQTVNRPLHLFVRGGIENLPQFATAFNRVTLISTDIIMKSLKRRSAVIVKGTAKWHFSPTTVGTPVDDLVLKNYHIIKDWISPMVALKPKQQWTSKN